MTLSEAEIFQFALRVINITLRIRMHQILHVCVPLVADILVFTEILQKVFYHSQRVIKAQSECRTVIIYSRRFL